MTVESDAFDIPPFLLLKLLSYLEELNEPRLSCYGCFSLLHSFHCLFDLSSADRLCCFIYMSAVFTEVTDEKIFPDVTLPSSSATNTNAKKTRKHHKKRKQKMNFRAVEEVIRKSTRQVKENS